MKWVWKQVHFPQPFDAVEAVGFVQRLAADESRGPLVFEARSEAGTIRHLVGGAQTTLSASTSVLRRLIPDAVLTDPDDPRVPVSLASSPVGPFRPSAARRFDMTFRLVIGGGGAEAGGSEGSGGESSGGESSGGEDATREDVGGEVVVPARRPLVIYVNDTVTYRPLVLVRDASGTADGAGTETRVRPSLLVACEADAAIFDRLGKTTTNRTEDESGHVTLGLQGKTSGFAREFQPTIKQEADVFEKF